MERLIDADALKYNINHTKGLYLDEELRKIIDEAPRVVARLDGEWQSDGTCSICRAFSSLNKDTVNFCPNCGASMQEEHNND